jgi:hypothetical protein
MQHTDYTHDALVQEAFRIIGNHRKELERLQKQFKLQHQQLMANYMPILMPQIKAEMKVQRMRKRLLKPEEGK